MRQTRSSIRGSTRAAVVLCCSPLAELPKGWVVRVASWVISAQWPPTTKRMGFVVLEDETDTLPPWLAWGASGAAGGGGCGSGGAVGAGAMVSGGAGVRIEAMRQRDLSETDTEPLHLRNRRPLAGGVPPALLSC